MHLFYTPDIEGDIYTLNADESRHCVRVLRLGAGEAVSLVDGKGTWYEGVIERAEVRGCEIRITDRRELYGRRNFHLHLAVAPTKNIDRIEWMLEKCTEMGIDEITLLHAAHSERKVVKEERLEKVIVAAMKQSLKAYLPRLNPMTDFRQLVTSCRSACRFYKRFCKAVGYLVGTGCRSGGGKDFVCFRCRECVFQDYRFNDSGASAGIHCYLGSGASGFCVDSFAADEGDGSRVARLAEPLAGLRAGSAESTSAGEFAGGRYRIYRFGQYAAQSNKKERIGVILSHEVICRNILSCSKGCYGTDCEWRCGLIRNL